MFNCNFILFFHFWCAPPVPVMVTNFKHLPQLPCTLIKRMLLLCAIKNKSPYLTMMNLLVNARPSFNGAADGTSYTSALLNGRSGRSMPTFVLGATSFNSFEVLSMEQLASSRAKPMVEGFYLDFGVVPSQSNTLYRHFVEIYSAFKQDIWALYTTKWGKVPLRVFCWGSNY